MALLSSDEMRQRLEMLSSRKDLLSGREHLGAKIQKCYALPGFGEAMNSMDCVAALAEHMNDLLVHTTRSHPL